MTRTDVKTPSTRNHSHDHGLTQADAALAGKAATAHTHPEIAALAARVTAAEKDAAVTKALLLSAIGDGSFHPPAPAVPGAPTGVSATAGDTTAAVTWTAAAPNGAAITDYVVTPYIGASAQTVAHTGSGSTSKTVTGLTNGTAYTFKVAATNSAGTGAQSSASASVTPSAGALTPITVGRGGTGIAITASNTTIDGYAITGPGADRNLDGTDNSFGIYGAGAFDNVTIRNCTITDFGHTGIYLANSGGEITNLTIEDCVIEDVVYGGIIVLGVHTGTIQRNEIRRVGVDGHDTVNGNCYGIAVTMSYGDYPSRYVMVNDNVVEDVPLWHGIDTHGGRYITFRHNTVKRCARAIFITRAADTLAEAPRDCVIENNLFTHPQSVGAPGTDDNTAMTEYGGVNNTFRYNHIGDSTVETGHAYANVYYDSGGLSTGTTLTSNTRSETLPSYP